MSVYNAGYIARVNDKKIVSFVYILGIFAIIMMSSIIITVGQITPDYNPISDTISRMGAKIAPYSNVLNTGYIIYGIIILIITFHLCKKLVYTKHFILPMILLLLHAFGSIFLAVFPDKPDIPGGYFTANIVHNIFSAMFYASLLLGIIVFSIKSLKDNKMKGIALFGIILVTLNIIMPFINVVSYLKEISGLLQRSLLFLSYFWVVITSSLIYKRAMLNYSERFLGVRDTPSLNSA
ncbi:MAG: DUF998 domain-containing protein [Dehalococcoidia bacterium]|nr:MAG: DUF998 domain-containing protein [Dehalococcoidia bacterium]